VLLRGEEILTNPEEMGLIVETTILRHLYAYYYRDTPRLVYWRDAASGKEVDIIVRSPAYVLPFEVKYKEKASLEEDGDTRNLLPIRAPQAGLSGNEAGRRFRCRKVKDAGYPGPENTGTHSELSARAVGEAVMEVIHSPLRKACAQEKSRLREIPPVSA